MVYYRRAKLAFDAFPSFISRAVTRAQPISQFRNYSTTLVSNKPKLIPGFSSPYSILSPKPNGLRKLNPFVGSYVRFYHAGLMGFVGIAGLVAASYLRFSEKVPFTNRRRLMLMTLKMDMALGEDAVEDMKRECAEKILCARDPKSLRVRMIFKRIFDAMKRDLGSDIPPHVVHMNWEIFVLDDWKHSAICTYGGKIMVSSWLLDFCRSDIGLATVIAHEVGHGVAEHPRERGVFDSVLGRLSLRPPFVRRYEYEADHIGLMLLASAGYDPSAVSLVYDRWARLARLCARFLKKDVKDVCFPHPSIEKRGEMVARTNIMEEALRRYQTVGAEVTVSERLFDAKEEEKKNEGGMENQ